MRRWRTPTRLLTLRQASRSLEGRTHNSDCTLAGTACGTSDGLLVHYNFNFICHFSGFGTYFFFTDRSIQQATVSSVKRT